MLTVFYYDDTRGQAIDSPTEPRHDGTPYQFIRSLGITYRNFDYSLASRAIRFNNCTVPHNVVLPDFVRVFADDELKEVKARDLSQQQGEFISSPHLTIGDLR